jgi:hypothetical protein
VLRCDSVSGTPNAAGVTTSRVTTVIRTTP